MAAIAMLQAFSDPVKTHRTCGVGPAFGPNRPHVLWEAEDRGHADLGQLPGGQRLVVDQ
jgi:hypothetical protein